MLRQKFRELEQEANLMEAHHAQSMWTGIGSARIKRDEHRVGISESHQKPSSESAEYTFERQAESSSVARAEVSDIWQPLLSCAIKSPAAGYVVEAKKWFFIREINL